MEFCSCARGRQWCGIIHYYWWTASIKPRLRFSRAGYASWGLSLSSVFFITSCSLWALVLNRLSRSTHCRILVQPEASCIKGLVLSSKNSSIDNATRHHTIRQDHCYWHCGNVYNNYIRSISAFFHCGFNGWLHVAHEIMSRYTVPRCSPRD